MTKAEQNKIRRAIKLFYADDRFEDAVDILFKLTGQKNHVLNVLKSAKSVSICEFEAEGVNNGK